MDDSTRQMRFTPQQRQCVDMLDDVFGGGSKLAVVVRKNDDPVEALQMECLRKEASDLGLLKLQELRTNKIRVNEARYSVFVFAIDRCAIFNLTQEQRDELIQIGFRTAGVLRAQLALRQLKKSA